VDYILRTLAGRRTAPAGAHATDRQTVTQKMRGLLDILLRNPALSPPIGLEVAAGLVARTPLIGVNRSVVQYEVFTGFLW
jgi:hypothetical protein